MGNASVSFNQGLSLGDLSSVLMCRFPVRGQWQILLFVAHSCIDLKIRILLGDNWAQNVVLSCDSDYRDEYSFWGIVSEVFRPSSFPA